MLRITKLGFVYFAIVFSVGFALGLVRVPLIEPWLGVRWAEVSEMPLDGNPTRERDVLCSHLAYAPGFHRFTASPCRTDR